MATANDLTDGAWLKCGITDPTDTQDTQALTALNNMLGTWSVDFIVPYVTRENFALTVGKAEYTVGSGGDFDTVRPFSIANCHLRDSAEYSYRIKVRSADDYNRVDLKTLEGRPKFLYYIPEYTLAKIIFDMEMDEAYTAYFEFWKHLTELAALGTTVSLPNEFKEGVIYNLAIRLAENESIQLPQTVYLTADSSYNLISRVQSMNRPPPLARFDFYDGIPYNITTGE